ncbi:MAG: ribosomal L7Ae/L30e/S12e/Gadd45 family protein [Tenericutes bacterium]|nr:ribosomal L7Ae/L30e/S12e/Gadd45 family protein [Mycoplasmatota bacterium]
MNNVLNTLGLCKRANKLISGEELVLGKVKKNAVYIVFLASDAGKNTTKRMTDKTNFYKIRLVNTFTTEELNTAIGTQNRKVLAITSKDFTKLIEQKLDM